MQRILLFPLFALVMMSGTNRINSLHSLNLTSRAIDFKTDAQDVDASQDTPLRKIWFPTTPRSIGDWKASAEPAASRSQDAPPTDDSQFTNSLGEDVETQVIAAPFYAAYTEPIFRDEFKRTATKIIYPLGPDFPIRSFVFKNDSGNERTILYEWVQRKGGATEVPNARNLQQESDAAGGEPSERPEPGCIVRAMTAVHPADRLGLQARRNLEAVCRGLYAAFENDNGSTSVTVDSPSSTSLRRAIDATAKHSLLAAYATTTEGGLDSAYLTKPTAMPQLFNQHSDNLLPLNVGNFWRMRSQSVGKVSQDTLKVVGLVTSTGGIASIEVDINREGAPWRKELYSTDKITGIYLTAVKDETSPMIAFNKPLPLLRYGFKEGDQWNWQGSMRVEGKGNYPATAVSRVSGDDSVTTPAGTFRAFRIDTIFTLQDKGRSIRFPSVRWLAPHVGFVRRAYADKGQPATSEVTRFHIR